jgi:acyl dehydratase
VTDRPENPTRYWESLQVGERFRSRERTVSEAEIVDFATRYDPQYFHMDPEAAKDSIFGEVVASGVHNLAIWRQLDHEITGDIRWICGVAWDEFRWKRALRAGDTVHVTAECLSKRPSRSDRRRGIAVYRYKMINQDGNEIFHMDSTNLVERQTPDGNDGLTPLEPQSDTAL